MYDIAIYINDSPKAIQKKINKIYTGRQSPTEPGDINNALFQFVDLFIVDPERVAELKRAYAEGDNIGDGHIKQELGSAINELLEPMRARSEALQGREDELMEILKDGCARANTLAEETLAMVKDAARLDFFSRRLQYR